MKTEKIHLTVSSDLARYWRRLVEEVGPSSKYPVAGDRLMAAAAAQFRRQVGVREANQRMRDRRRAALAKAMRSPRRRQ